MMLKALRDEMSYGAVSRREQPLASHIPYLRHVEDRVIKTREGYVQSFIHLAGYSFETADMSEINARMLSRNDLIRTLGNSRFAITNTLIRREVKEGKHDLTRPGLRNLRYHRLFDLNDHVRFSPQLFRIPFYNRPRLSVRCIKNATARAGIMFDQYPVAMTYQA